MANPENPVGHDADLFIITPVENLSIVRDSLNPTTHWMASRIRSSKEEVKKHWEQVALYGAVSFAGTVIAAAFVERLIIKGADTLTSLLIMPAVGVATFSYFKAMDHFRSQADARSEVSALTNALSGHILTAPREERL